MTWPDTRLLDLFGVELPIVQAPMANSTGVDMAVAVAEAGGSGRCPCAALTDDKIRDGVARSGRARASPSISISSAIPAGQDPARDAAWLKRLAPY